VFRNVDKIQTPGNYPEENIQRLTDLWRMYTTFINHVMPNDNYTCCSVWFSENWTTEVVAQNVSIMAHSHTALSRYIMLCYMPLSPLKSNSNLPNMIFPHLPLKTTQLILASKG
jgi:hypothetical protein